MLEQKGRVLTDREQRALQIGLHLMEAFELLTGKPTDHKVNPITALRVARNLNQRSLAEKAGVSRGYISAIESGIIDNPGQRNIEKFNALAKALECDPGELRKQLSDFMAA